MARLRDPQTGCPWDQEQTFRSIASYTIEEAYEVADAIERNALDELKGELGDLLFQVVFHAQIASEAGLFDFATVVDAIVDKMTRRHPHVFADTEAKNSQQQTEQWETLKAAERKQQGQHSILDNIPLSLPALKRAEKLHKRVAGCGLKQNETTVIITEIQQQLDEVTKLIKQPNADQITEEALGVLLFTCSRLAWQLKQDPEQALRKSNERFFRRFQSVEQQLQHQGRGLAKASEQEVQAAWQEVIAKEISVQDKNDIQ